MKKFTFILLCSLFAQNINGQLLQGRVIDEETQEPLIGASVYFEGSSIGTLSDENGYFDLDAEGQINATLIISYIGYATVTLSEPTFEKSIRITMLPKAEQLAGIVLTNDPFSREEKLKAFKLEFLGESKAAKNSFIKNEDDIELHFSTKENSLTAYSDKLILIHNDYLGYIIKFDLQDFKIAFREQSLRRGDNVKYTTIHGFSRFTNMPNTNNQEIVERRVRSFYASPAHFLQTLWKNNFDDQRFTIRKNGKKITSNNLFKRIPSSKLGLKKFRPEKSKLSIKYVGAATYRSTIEVTNPLIFTVDPNGNCSPCKHLVFGGYMGRLRMADALPMDYNPQKTAVITDIDQGEDEKVKTALTNDIEAITLSGRVSDENGPVQNAAVIIKEKNRGTVTDEEGIFAIKVMPNDSILVQFLGKSSVTLAVSKTSNFLNILLKNAPESLDEVVVVQKEKIKWLPKEKTLGYGGAQKVEKKDITVSSGSLNESLAGKYSGVQTNKDGFSRAIIRGFSSLTQNNFPLVVIDGAPMPRANFRSARNFSTDVLNIVNPNDVVSVEILKGLAAANRYGGEGVNGVILIKTIYGTMKLTEEKTNQDYNSALLKDNNFIGTLEVEKQTFNAPYLNALEQQATVADAYQLYLEQRKNYANDPYYFINVYKVFRASDKAIASKILTKAIEPAGEDLSALKSIAFCYQEAGHHTEALSIYKKMVALDDSKIQAHRDLANSHVQSKNFEQGLKVYATLLDAEVAPVVDIPSVKEVVVGELKNLIYRHEDKLDLSKIAAVYKTHPRYDARILLEWNRSDVEFDIEFISPEKKISKWSHTKLENEARIQQELASGYNMEEFLLSQAQKGDWYLNIKTYELQKNTPLLMKCTVEYKYGQAGQYAEEEVFTFNTGSSERLVTKIEIK